MPKLLITSVGSLVGQNLLDCLEDRRSGCTIVGTNSLADVAGLFRCDRVMLSPPAADARGWRALHDRVLHDEVIDLVIPGRDDDVLALAQWGQACPGLAPRLMAGRAETAQRLVDKVDYAAWAAARDLPFAPTVEAGLTDSAERAEALWRAHGVLVAKPRAGHGSRGVRLVHTAAQVRAAATTAGLALQPYFDPHPDWRVQAEALTLGLPLWSEVPETALYGVQWLIDPQGRLDGHLGYRAVQVAGRPTRVAPCPDASLVRVARQHAQALAEDGWRGPCNVQLKRDPTAGWQVIEVNGRFTGATHARRLLGFDEVGRALRQWLGSESVAEDGPATARPGRAEHGRWRADEDVASLQARGQWCREDLPPTR